VQSRDDDVYGIVGFFVPPPEDGEDLSQFYEQVCEEIDSHIWLICMTLTGWTHSDVIDMPDGERKKWAERCEEYQDKVREEIDRAKN